MSPDNPLTEVKEDILRQAGQTLSDEEIKDAEAEFSKSAKDDQARFDLAVQFIRSKRPHLVEAGIGLLKSIFSSLSFSLNLGISLPHRISNLQDHQLGAE